MALSRRQFQLEEGRATVAIITIKTRTCLYLLPCHRVSFDLFPLYRSSCRLRAVASSGTPIYRVERLKVITLASATLSFAFFIEKLLQWWI